MVQEKLSLKRQTQTQFRLAGERGEVGAWGVIAGVRCAIPAGVMGGIAAGVLGAIPKAGVIGATPDASYPEAAGAPDASRLMPGPSCAMSDASYPEVAEAPDASCLILKPNVSCAL
jgi:hypothetical protein